MEADSSTLEGGEGERSLAFCRLRQKIDLMNTIYWIAGGEVDMAKFCHLTQGFVRDDFQCEKCTMCAVKDK